MKPTTYKPPYKKSFGAEIAVEKTVDTNEGLIQELFMKVSDGKLLK